MQKKIKYYFLICTVFLCFFSAEIFNLNHSTINTERLIDNKTLKFSQGTQLTLNQKLKNQHVGFIDIPRYYITVPIGNIHIKVGWDSFWGMDLKLEVFSNLNFTDRIGFSDLGDTKERVDLTIEEEMTIYIKVTAKSGSGYFNIHIYNDAYIARQETKMISIIVTIVIGVLFIISAGVIIYLRNYSGVTRWRARVNPQNPYRQKQEGSIEQPRREFKGRNLVICSNCGNKTPRSKKFCEFCGYELNRI
ncbi:MAG: zinc ribbon domain-containing protein [Promethearchaeota archaeon]